MGQLTTQGMSRLTAAGSLSNVDEAVRSLADLKAVHLLDYPGDEEGFDLGSPADESEEIGRDLNRYRSASSQLDLSGPKKLLESVPIRSHLGGELPSRIEVMLGHLDRADAIDSELSSMEEEEEALELLRPLDLALSLLSGYESLTVFLGTVKDVTRAESCAPGGIVMIEGDKPTVVAVFCENGSANEVQSELAEAGFSAISVPDGEGSIVTRQEVLAARRDELLEERSALQGELDSWAEANGAILLGGIELLERDMALALGPIRVAVSGHAFVIDGWIERSRSEEVGAVLSKTCEVIDIEPFKIAPGGGGHAHHGSELKLPPIKFADRSASKPMELLTDLMGRPRYGKVDPTLFMFFTYPLFFGLILGDILYGAATILFGYFLYKRIGHTETGLLASKFVAYIGIAAVVFGYIYGEFAGFEILPHGHCDIEAIVGASACEAAHGHWHWEASSAPDWAIWLTALYPSGGEIYYEWSWDFGGLVIAFPLHRVVPNSAGGNLQDLLLLTIYMGAVHVLLGLIIGFRDVWLHGDSHGNAGPVVAFFDRGSWMTLLIGGYIFAKGFLGLKSSPGDETLTMMQSYGGILIVIGVLMLSYASYKYHGMPIFIAALLGPIEGIGMMPTIISYVRLFAVGVAGVKIAETGNEMLYGHIEDGHATGMLGVLDGLAHNHDISGVMLLLLLLPVIVPFLIKFGKISLPVNISFGRMFLGGFLLSGLLGFALGAGNNVFMLMILFFSWLGVQIFAWILGLVSPNIHTARLHVVEWMKQFYEAVGDKFEPFGFTARVVEVE
ncbi:MAG: hypothetical protein VX652_01990 [Candidatus Thermoplasmatota archaeon]|nr:hypothetical protein [Candidatus Thermoplasmatota archaeon]